MHPHSLMVHAQEVIRVILNDALRLFVCQNDLVVGVLGLHM